MITYWPKDENDKVLRQMERFHRASRTQRDWAERAQKSTDYLEGRQWSEADKAAMRAEGRPMLTFNKIWAKYALIAGYQRSQHLQVGYIPATDGPSSQATADVLSKISKSLDQSQRSRMNDAMLFGDGLVTGRAYLDIRMSYEDNLLGAITEKTEFPFTVYPDPDGSTYEPVGWGHVFTNRWMSLGEIDYHFGKGASDRVTRGEPVIHGPIYSELDGEDEDLVPPRWFRLKTLVNDDEADWPYGASILDHVDPTRKLVRVLEQQHVVVTNRLFFIDPVTGDKKAVPDHWDRNRIARVLAFATGRGENLNVLKMPDKRIRWTVTAADQVLYDEWSPYRSFTLVPYFPYFRYGYTKGRIEDWCDPQDEINKRRSNYIEIITRVANSALLYDKDSVPPETEERLEDDLAAPGTQIGLTFRPGRQIFPPQYIQPPIPPQAFQRLEADAAQDMLEISGITAAALGEDQRVQSGRALLAKQQATLVSFQNEFDNLRHTKELQGEKRLELIQDFYTEPRLIRSMGEESQIEEIKLNQRDAAGAIVNDVSFGKYDVHVEPVPDSPTFQQAQLEEALELREKGVPVPDDILVGLTRLENKAVIQRQIRQVLAAQGVGPSSAVPGKMAGTGRPAADRPVMG